MNRSNEQAFSKESFLAAVERLAPKRKGKPEVSALLPFLEQYQADAFIEDFFALTTNDAASLALDLWEFNRDNQEQPSRVIRTRRAISADGKPLKMDIAEIVGPDMAFLVDSAIAACQEAKVEVRAILHPVIPGPHGKRSAIQIHLPQLDDALLADVQRKLEEAFADVAVVNSDHMAMRSKMEQARERLSTLKATSERSAEEVSEARQFLSWLLDENFTFLGARDYTFALDAHGQLAAEEPIVDEKSGLGILRDMSRNVLSRAAEPTVLTPAIRAFINEPSPIIVAKASFISRVHRRSHADYIGVKRYDAPGDVIGETRFVGLFTSEAYTRTADEVPLIRRKIEKVKAASASGSRFSMKQLDSVLMNYPRDELFQISETDLGRIAHGVLRLHLRPRTRLFIRRDRFDRYVSALLYVPRDSYNSDLRTRAHRIIAEAYGGRTSAFYPSFGDGPLARVHLIVGLTRGHPEPDEDGLDLQMRQLFETWEDALGRVARSTGSDHPLLARARFTAAYKEAFQPEEGLADLIAIGVLPPGKALRARVWGPEMEAGISHVKIYHRDQPLDLSEIVPVLERMGLRVRAEVGYPIRFSAARGEADGSVYVHDLAIDRPAGQRRLDARFEAAFEAIWARETENDRFNSLVVALGVDWRSAALLRTLARYRSQSGLDPSEAVQVRALADHPEIANGLLKLFAIKFDPGIPGDLDARRKAADPVIADIDKQLEAVATLDADRVLRRLLALVKAAQRTNSYMTDPNGRAFRHIAVKIASREADPLPAPRPFREIFVWSPDVEGVHLRFGPVARGGLRWSDRREDFRTEILGLMRAQNVKNTVIVPVGAKGGFVPRRPPADRDEAQADGMECYRWFIRALLDVTDNVAGGKVVPPARVVRHDGDDPYLVVAADKGTAKFSDVANAISEEYGFWLGDAFASGGSAGYDHKGMAITARGGWESVRRHFRELGLDTQSQDFTVAGIGDMSGDVFGNAMLLSPHIRLLAAFDHRHIFLDPSPDAARSFAERKRMFELPRSSWEDYDKRLLSKGGGVYSRQSKSIPLSHEARALLGIDSASVAPAEVVRCVLRLPVDLLWNGGIGTYVKSADETHAEIGDRANDAVRVNGAELRCRVAGEGGNLGFSQRGRIEYALAGGRINTDFIDNSAGVNCSDVEVNLKILFNPLMAAGKLTRKARNRLLESMTDEVAELVLRNNYLQSLAISGLHETAAERIFELGHLLRSLERAGTLDRALEALPTDDDIVERHRKGQRLTRPELAMLLSYAKIWLSGRLMDTDVAGDPYLGAELTRYFPKPVQRRYPREILRHQLSREIIVTATTNSLVNRMGPGFAIRTQEDTGADVGSIARAYSIAREITDMRDLWADIEALDDKVPAPLQYAMSHETMRLLRRLTYWVLRNFGMNLDIERAVSRLRPGIRELMSDLPDLIEGIEVELYDKGLARFSVAGVPESVARRVASLGAIHSSVDIVEFALTRRAPVAKAARVYFGLGAAIGLDWIRGEIERLPVEGHWQALARGTMREEAYLLQRRLADQVLSRGHSGDVAKRIMAWLRKGGAAYENVSRTVREMRTTGNADFPTLSVALQAVRQLSER